MNGLNREVMAIVAGHSDKAKQAVAHTPKAKPMVRRKLRFSAGVPHVVGCGLVRGALPSDLGKRILGLM